MRRFLVIGVLAALIAGVFAVSASARTETQFSVIAHQRGSGHQIGENKFAIHGQLLSPTDRDDVVGRFAAKFNKGGLIHARAFFPDGTLKARGKGSRILVIGGTGRWNGAAGKLKTHNLNKRNTLLSFDIVQ